VVDVVEKVGDTEVKVELEELDCVFVDAEAEVEAEGEDVDVVELDKVDVELDPEVRATYPATAIIAIITTTIPTTATREIARFQRDFGIRFCGSDLRLKEFVK
jgi:hypothetical protein